MSLELECTHFDYSKVRQKYVCEIFHNNHLLKIYWCHMHIVQTWQCMYNTLENRLTTVANVACEHISSW